jgi:hypothetical protein
MGDVLFIVYSALAVILLAASCGPHFRAGNVGAIALVGWCMVFGALGFVNHIVYFNSYEDRTPVWCDIGGSDYASVVAALNAEALTRPHLQSSRSSRLSKPVSRPHAFASIAGWPSSLHRSASTVIPRGVSRSRPTSLLSSCRPRSSCSSATSSKLIGTTSKKVMAACQRRTGKRRLLWASSPCLFCSLPCLSAIAVSTGCASLLQCETNPSDFFE